MREALTELQLSRVTHCLWNRTHGAVDEQDTPAAVETVWCEGAARHSGAARLSQYREIRCQAAQTGERGEQRDRNPAFTIHVQA